VGLGGAAGGAGAKQDTESHDLLELLDFKANKVGVDVHVLLCECLGGSPILLPAPNVKS
jgi:hypothetical protein